MRSAESDRTPWLLCGALALGLAVQLLLPTPPLPAVTLHAERSAHMQPAPPLPAIPAYAYIAERPLFTPGRSASETVADDAAPVGVFTLLGVASTGGAATAVIRSGSGGDPLVVRLGEGLQGWRVTAIGRDMAVVSRGAVSQTLHVGVSATPVRDASGAGRASVARRQQP